MSEELYKYAAKNALRLPSKRGQLMVEQLFDLPLKAASGFDLDSVARAVSSELKAVGEESFVETAKTDPRKRPLEVALEIVKDVIKTKQDENAAALARKDRSEKRQKLLDALAIKENEKISQASVDEIKKQLDELDA